MNLELEAARLALDCYEKGQLAADPNCDPLASKEAQALLTEYRRLNALAMSKLTPADKFEMMFKGIK